MAQVVVELSGDEAKLLQAMQRVIAQGQKMGEGFKKAGNDGKSASRQIEESLQRAATNITGVVGGFTLMKAAIAGVVDVQEKFTATTKEALEFSKQLATAQQEAAKNLAGTSQKDISKALLVTVPEIAKRANFSDLPKITTALGSTASIVGEEKAQSAVGVAAELTRFKKEDLQVTATAIGDLMKAGQFATGEEAASVLLTAGSKARPEQLGKLAQGASKVAIANVDASPNQDPAEAAKEAIALYAAFTKVDPEGQASATVAIQFTNLLKETFNPTLEDAAKRDAKIAAFQKENEISPEEAVRIRRAEFEVSQKERIVKRINPNDMSGPAQDARLDLDEARVNLAKEKEAAVLDTKDASELKKLLAQQSFSKMDPGTLRSRMSMIQQSPELVMQAQALLKSEAAFKSIGEGFLDPNSVHMKELNANFDTVSSNPERYREARDSMVLTPQQKQQFALETAMTGTNVAKFRDTEIQNYGAIDDIVQRSFKEAPVGGALGMFRGSANFIAKQAGIDLEAITPSSVAGDGIQANRNARLTLLNQRAELMEWGTNDVSKMSPSTQQKIATVDASIQALDQLLQAQMETINELKSIGQKLEQQNQEVKSQGQDIRTNNQVGSTNAIRAMANNARMS